MVPSLVNLVIGGTSLVRGLPGVPALLLRCIPERGGVLKWDRHWIGTILTAQVAAGAALGIAAQAFLVVVIIGYAMPLFGPELPPWPARLPPSICRRGRRTSSGSTCGRRMVALVPEPDFDERPKRGLPWVEPGWPR
jgi:hypothetical protein